MIKLTYYIQCITTIYYIALKKKYNYLFKYFLIFTNIICIHHLNFEMMNHCVEKKNNFKQKSTDNY